MCSHMGLTASRPPDEDKAFIYNGVEQEQRQKQEEPAHRRKELGQNQQQLGRKMGQKAGQKSSQNREEPELCKPIVVAGATQVDNEAATLPHPKEQRPQK